MNPKKAETFMLEGKVLGAWLLKGTGKVVTIGVQELPLPGKIRCKNV